MSARAILPLAAVIAVMVLVGGCGGDGEDTAGAAAASKAEFLKQANAGCRRARAGLRKMVSDFLELQRGRKPRPLLNADLAQLVLLPTIENEMEAVRVVKPPPGEKERIERLLYLEESALTRVVYMKRLPSIDAMKRVFARSVKKLRAYGLAGCTNGPQA